MRENALRHEWRRMRLRVFKDEGEMTATFTRYLMINFLRHQDEFRREFAARGELTRRVARELKVVAKLAEHFVVPPAYRQDVPPERDDLN
jgi:hypothetical protein